MSTMNPSTVFALMYEFGSAHIPLVAVAKKYFGYDENTANRYARQSKFPFPVFRLGGQLTPWMVDAAELAAYLDKIAAKAKKQYKTAKDEAA
jgi:hypothetical protein